MRVRPIDPGNGDEVRLVTDRMRQTLIEVLGQEIGESMYSMEWLVDRLRFHLDPSQCVGAVFVAEDSSGEIVGHTIVRIENEEEGKIGLFSTTYVVPEARKLGVASMLLRHGEAWMRSQGMTKGVTYTDVDNAPLRSLYEKHGYVATPMPNRFIALSKPL